MSAIKPKALDVMKIMIDQFRFGLAYVEFENRFLDWEERAAQFRDRIKGRKPTRPLPKYLIAEMEALDSEFRKLRHDWECCLPTTPFYVAANYWRYQDQQRKEKESNGKIQTESDEEEGLHQRDGLSVGEAG